MRIVGKYGKSWKVEWGFYGAFNGSVEEGRKKKEKGAENFYFKSGAYENPAKNRWLFSQKAPS